KIAIDQLYEEEVPYKKVGVVASRLVHEDYVQTNLFQTETTAGNNPMMVIDQINRKFGGDYIALGKEIAGVTNKGKSYLSPAYTTNWQQIKKVKA
ncbi:SOS mutagenesis and repair protein UmuC, partial [bacterium]|nr:SOS mutagenesis and repair protein UmuC [bacterium]